MSHWFGRRQFPKVEAVVKFHGKNAARRRYRDQTIQELQHVFFSGYIELVGRRTKNKPWGNAQVGQASGPKERIGWGYVNDRFNPQLGGIALDRLGGWPMSLDENGFRRPATQGFKCQSPGTGK